MNNYGLSTDDKGNCPDEVWRKKIWDIINTNAFDIMIMSFIVLNMIQMAMNYEG